MARTILMAGYVIFFSILLDQSSGLKTHFYSPQNSPFYAAKNAATFDEIIIIVCFCYSNLLRKLDDVRVQSLMTIQYTVDKYFLN